MGTLDRSSENLILTNLDEIDAELANGIRELRFTFEDLINIEDQGLQLVLKDVNQEDLIISLKTASDALKEKIFNNMSERASMMVKEDLESMGPKKVSDVEASQAKIIKVCKKLEDEGKISTGGGAEDQYV